MEIAITSSSRCKILVVRFGIRDTTDSNVAIGTTVITIFRRNAVMETNLFDQDDSETEMGVDQRVQPANFTIPASGREATD